MKTITFLLSVVLFLTLVVTSQTANVETITKTLEDFVKTESVVQENDEVNAEVLDANNVNENESLGITGDEHEDVTESYDLDETF